jgi:hypothetical protein
MGRSKKAVAALVIAASLMAACSVTNIGGIHLSREVELQFERFGARPDYRYWYLNQENNPFGVVGLDHAYMLEDDPNWQPVAPDSDSFRKIVGLVQSFPLPGQTTSGYAITDPQGRQIGVWYSSLGAGITVDPQTKTVSISTMMPWLFNEDF